MQLNGKCVLLWLWTTFAWAGTAKEKTLLWSFGGCGTGLAVGAYLDSRDQAENKSSAATLAMNGLIGCAAGLIGSWLFVDDEQKPLAQENANLRGKLDQYELLLADRGVAASTPREDYLGTGSGRFVERQGLSTDLARLIDSSCQAVEYTLGFDDDSGRPGFIPVSGQVAIQAFKYYLVVPKDGTDRDCVRPHAAFGYLSRELKNLPEILIDKAKRKGDR